MGVCPLGGALAVGPHPFCVRESNTLPREPATLASPFQICRSNLLFFCLACKRLRNSNSLSGSIYFTGICKVFPGRSASCTATIYSNLCSWTHRSCGPRALSAARSPKLTRILGLSFFFKTAIFCLLWRPVIAQHVGEILRTSRAQRRAARNDVIFLSGVVLRVALMVAEPWGHIFSEPISKYVPGILAEPGMQGLGILPPFIFSFIWVMSLCLFYFFSPDFGLFFVLPIIKPPVL